MALSDIKILSPRDLSEPPPTRRKIRIRVRGSGGEGVARSDDVVPQVSDLLVERLDLHVLAHELLVLLLALHLRTCGKIYVCFARMLENAFVVCMCVHADMKALVGTALPLKNL